jgi:hypothetical protein
VKMILRRCPYPPPRREESQVDERSPSCCPCGTLATR